MSLDEQGFDGFPILAGAQFLVSQAVLNVESGIEISVCVVAADPAAKRLLGGPVGAVDIMAHAALLRGVGAPDLDGGHASFGSIPGDLFGEVPQVGGVQVGVHGTRLVLHRGDRQVFVGKLVALVLGKALVDRAVDFLAHMPGETLPCATARGGKLLDAFLLQAFAQLRLAPPLLAVAEGAVVLAGTGRNEVRDAHVHADHRGRRGGVDRDFLVIAEGHPPAITALVEGHAGIDGLSFERLAVIGSQLDGDQHLLAEFQRADREPVVKGRVLRGSQCDNIDVGLDAGLPQHRDMPLAPRGFFGPCLQGALRLLLVVVQQVIRIVLVGLCAIGAPGLGDACRLLDGHPLPAFGKGGGKERGTYLIRTLIGTKQSNVLLAEREVDLGEGIEGGELAFIGRFEPDMGHGSGDRLRVVWPSAVVLTLLHLYCFSFEPHRCCAGIVFRVS
jgi:hypothetical protein